VDFETLKLMRGGKRKEREKKNVEEQRRSGQVPIIKASARPGGDTNRDGETSLAALLREKESKGEGGDACRKKTIGKAHAKG